VATKIDDFVLFGSSVRVSNLRAEIFRGQSLAVRNAKNSPSSQKNAILHFLRSFYVFLRSRSFYGGAQFTLNLSTFVSFEAA